jgi:nitrate/TMAO reductase-like tetraheme cytochrome c subunit
MKGKIHLLNLVLFVCFTSLAAYSQISPGDLVQAHAHLEGMSNCTQCHTLGDQVSNEKCLACHTEIKSRVDQRKGYHASTQVRGKRCVICHNDHHGRNFKIVKFEKEKFDHTLAGYKLEGAHAGKTCADCHKPANITDGKIRAKKSTYLGLSTSCVPCHEDYHQKTLSSNCSDCHTYEKFVPASGFSHTKAKFQLTGKHQEVTCADCHKTTSRNGKKFQEFKGIKYSKCTDCHLDAHNNKFGQNCTECHNTNSFKAVGGVSNFDHSKADFKLEGKHLSVACKSCHKVKLTTPLNFRYCTDCHTDYHEKQFARNGISPDCSSCHTVNGFAGSSYTLEQHNQGVFPLTGAHLATPCVACHKKEVKWKFREIGKNCRDCHVNIHKGFISESYYTGETCESCHNSNAWNEVTFDHKKTTFALEGAHARNTCRDCHFNKEPKGYASQKFAGLGSQCSGCHTDVHRRQFDLDGISDCSRCHGSDSFVPAARFNHNNTLFPLDGKHAGLACNQCHKEVADGNETYVFYKIKDFRCEDCHK